MVYYPTAEGQASYVHYTGRLDGQALRTVDEWHLLNGKADGVLRDLMTANNVTVQSALVKAPEKAHSTRKVSSPPALSVNKAFVDSARIASGSPSIVSDNFERISGVIFSA